MVRYRALRRSCRLTITEIARSVGISAQRLSQIEHGLPGYQPANPERLITALEQAVGERKTECENALNECKTMRCSMFEQID